MQADGLWQQAMKQLNDNQLEGNLLVVMCYSISDVITDAIFLH